MADVVEGAADLPEEERAALHRHVLTLADSKRLMGIRYSDWTLGAPSIETSIATSSMAQDEWGHGRLLYAMLKDFGEDPKEVEHERDASAYASVDALDEPFETWADVVAGMVIVDRALTAALEAFAGGRYEPARSRIPKMVGEEVFHGDLARAWFRRLAAGTDEARERLGAAVRRMLPSTLAWLDPSDDAHGALVGGGLVEDSALFRFRKRAGALLDLLEIGLADAEAARDSWDAGRGRGPGHPAEEAVERARGDRNRALFVE